MDGRLNGSPRTRPFVLTLPISLSGQRGPRESQAGAASQPQASLRYDLPSTALAAASIVDIGSDTGKNVLSVHSSHVLEYGFKSRAVAQLLAARGWHGKSLGVSGNGPHLLRRRPQETSAVPPSAPVVAGAGPSQGCSVRHCVDLVHALLAGCVTGGRVLAVALPAPSPHSVQTELPELSMRSGC